MWRSCLPAVSICSTRTIDSGPKSFLIAAKVFSISGVMNR
jgi:hypothetical protein